MQACDKCGVDLRYPTAAHIVDCSTVFEKRHGRPKPPPLGSEEYDEYQEKYDTIQVFHRETVWLTGSWAAATKYGGKPFPTHAEAIAWAMKEVSNA